MLTVEIEDAYECKVREGFLRFGDEREREFGFSLSELRCSQLTCVLEYATSFEFEFGFWVFGLGS